MKNKKIYKPRGTYFIGMTPGNQNWLPDDFFIFLGGLDDE